MGNLQRGQTARSIAACHSWLKSPQSSPNLAAESSFGACRCAVVFFGAVWSFGARRKSGWFRRRGQRRSTYFADQAGGLKETTLPAPHADCHGQSLLVNGLEGNPLNMPERRSITHGWRRNTYHYLYNLRRLGPAGVVWQARGVRARESHRGVCRGTHVMGDVAKQDKKSRLVPPGTCVRGARGNATRGTGGPRFSTSGYFFTSTPSDTRPPKN